MGSYVSSYPKIEPKLTGRVAVVTGANRGLGYETAKQLYEAGAIVYLGCRSEANALKAIERIRAEVTESEGQLKWFTADMSSIKKSKESAETLLKVESQLDILVHNAGIGDRKYELNEDGIEVTMATNHIGPFIFTKVVLEVMKKTSSKQGSDVRIISVSSRAHDLLGGQKVQFADEAELTSPFPAVSYDAWRSRLARYGRSKLANILFASELQRRLDSEKSNIIAISVHPGTVTTDGALGAMATIPIIGPLVRVIASYIFMSEPDGARTSVFAAANPLVRAEPEKYKGKYLTPFGKVTRPSKIAQDIHLARQLWDLSEKIVEKRVG
ncbi:hypothetical protein FRC07_009458 [Ceratobasidium sp. 392]|nr:hypothetical protein FRC07_009458 [Ceratobasidium sp. 392]